MLPGSAGREISEEEGNYPLIPSSTAMKRLVKLKLWGHRHATVPGDINAFEKFEQISEGNLLKYFKDGWQIVPKLTNREVIMYRQPSINPER